MARHFFRALFLATLLLLICSSLAAVAETESQRSSAEPSESSSSLTGTPTPAGEEEQLGSVDLPSSPAKQAANSRTFAAPNCSPHTNELPVETSSNDPKQPDISAGPNKNGGADSHAPKPTNSEEDQPHHNINEEDLGSKPSNQAPSLANAFQAVNLTEVVAQCLDLAGCSELLTTSAIAARHAFTERAESARQALAGRAESAKERASAGVAYGVRWWNVTTAHVFEVGAAAAGRGLARFRHWLEAGTATTSDAAGIIGGARANGVDWCANFSAGHDDSDSSESDSSGLNTHVSNQSLAKVWLARACGVTLLRKLLTWFSVRVLPWLQAFILALARVPLLWLVGGFWLACLLFGSWATLRVPILFSLSVALGVEFWAYWVVRLTIHGLELLPSVRLLKWWLPIPVPRLQLARQQRELAHAMWEASDYDTWRHLAVEMDKLHGRESWKDQAEDSRYHAKLVVAATHRLRRARELRDPRLLMDTLTPCLVKDFGGAMNTTLYAQTHVGTKRAVEDLFAEINRGLTWLMALDPGALKEEEEARDEEEEDEEDEGESAAASSIPSFKSTTRKSSKKPTTRSSRRTKIRKVRNNNNEQSDEDDGDDNDENVNHDENENEDEAYHYDDSLGEGGFRRARSGSFGSDAFRKKRLAFFKAAQRSFGNTALLMSGGATLGIYHLGYLKALGARSRLPKVVSGTSAGAVLAAFMAVRTDDEVAATFADPELEEWWWQFGPTGPLHGSWAWKAMQIHKKGRIYDYKDFMRAVSWFVGEGDSRAPVGSAARQGLGLKSPTFGEAYARTGRLVNITCTPFKTAVKGVAPLMLNHLTAPHVTLASAACASSCVPMLIEPVALLEKDPRTGELRPYKAHTHSTPSEDSPRPAAKTTSSLSARNQSRSSSAGSSSSSSSSGVGGSDSDSRSRGRNANSSGSSAKKRSTSSDSRTTTAATPQSALSPLPELLSTAPPLPPVPPSTPSLPPAVPKRSLRATPSRLARTQREQQQVAPQDEEPASSSSATLVSFGNLGMAAATATSVTASTATSASGSAEEVPVSTPVRGGRRASSRKTPTQKEASANSDASSSSSSSSSGVAAEIAAEQAIEQATKVAGSGSGTGTDSGSGAGSAGISAAAAAGDDFDIPLEHLRMRDGSFESDVPVQAIAELFNCHFTIVSQVNPHIIPFFYHNRGRDGRPSTWRLWAGGWRGGFVLSALELWLKEDMLKTLRVLAGLDLLIEVFGVNWSYLYLQEARGDVTLIPDASFHDYLMLIDNLTNRAELKRRVRASERACWQCMSRIEHRMSLQATLDDACRRLGLPDH